MQILTCMDIKVAKGTGLKISHHQLEFRGRLCHDYQHEQGKAGVYVFDIG